MTFLRWRNDLEVYGVPADGESRRAALTWLVCGDTIRSLLSPWLILLWMTIRRR